MHISLLSRQYFCVLNLRTATVPEQESSKLISRWPDGMGWLCRQYTQDTTEAVLLEANQRQSVFQAHYFTNANLTANFGGAGTQL